MRARSPGVSRAISSLQALDRSGALPAMLPLTSISAINRIGCGEFSKMVTGCGLPLSKIWKSPRARSVTSRPDLSTTVTKSGTTSAVLRKTGVCGGAAWDTAAHTARVRTALRNIVVGLRQAASRFDHRLPCPGYDA